MKTSDVAAGVIFAALLIALIIYGFLVRKVDRSKWVKTIGVVKSLTYGRSGTRGVTFTTGEGAIEDALADYGLPGRCPGDTYEILYNPQDLREIYILEDKPLFLEGEAIDTTIGVITNSPKADVGDGYKRTCADFDYIGDSREYKRTQVIQVPFDKPLIIKKGMKFRVRYWLHNPQRSILDFLPLR